MDDQSKTKHELIQELVSLRKRIAELSQYESEHKQAEESLRESEYQYKNLIENIPDIIFITIDLEGKITFISKRTKEILGYENEETINMSIFNFIPEEDHQRAMETLQKGMKGEKIKHVQLPVTAKSGKKLFFDFSFSRIYKDGVVIGAQGTAVDVTERKQVEKALRENEARHREREERYRNIIDNMEEAYYEVDLKGNLTFFNATAVTNLGYTDNVMMGMNFRQYVDEENASKVFEAYNKVFLTGESIKGLDWELISKGSGKIPIESSISLMRDAQGNPIGFRGIIRDITDRKRAEDALRESEHRYQKMSIIDDLTQIYNSRHFHAQLEREIERSNRYGQPLALLLLDIDKFKAFNDTYGHVEGDNMLSRLGQVVKRCLRDPDSAYRYGGDEFTIMLPMTTSKEGIVTAKRIQTELRKEAFSPVLGKEVYMTVSIGLAQYKPKEEMKAFVQRVDQLMYQAKKNGKDSVCSELRR